MLRSVHDGNGVEVGQAIGYISEDLLWEWDVGMCLHALLQVHNACTP